MVKKINSAKLTDVRKGDASQIWKKSMVGKTVYACTFVQWVQTGTIDGLYIESPHLCQAKVVSIEEVKGRQRIFLQPLNFVVVGDGELHFVRENEFWSESPVEVVLHRIRQMCQWMAASILERTIALISVIGEPEKVRTWDNADPPELNIHSCHETLFYAYSDVLRRALRIERLEMPILADCLYSYVFSLLGCWNSESSFLKCLKVGENLIRREVRETTEFLKEYLNIDDFHACIEKNESGFVCHPMKLYEHLKTKGLWWKIVIKEEMLDENPTTAIEDAEGRIEGAEWDTSRTTGAFGQFIIGVIRMPKKQRIQTYTAWRLDEK